VVQQRFGDGLGGGADVEDQRAVVGHFGRHGARNARLAVGVERFALRVCNVLDGRAGHAHAAVKASHQALFGQALHVAPHGLQCDAQGFGELFDGDGLALPYFIEQQELAGIGVHADLMAPMGAL
jgi:hypothetical protein